MGHPRSGFQAPPSHVERSQRRGRGSPGGGRLDCDPAPERMCLESLGQRASVLWLGACQRGGVPEGRVPASGALLRLHLCTLAGGDRRPRWLTARCRRTRARSVSCGPEGCPPWPSGESRGIPDSAPSWSEKVLAPEGGDPVSHCGPW